MTRCARGEGLGTRLLLAVAHGIRERRRVPFLHVLASNTGVLAAAGSPASVA
ncbi:GNAT family N-acetyltransferase [Lentzea sp. BCCO 10_0856]|uniref:GNAT family N-acetyltransferase n=1 Tax=Lentzea miocenica TaxID=3095431 RepID=A0ABU4SXE5_9PSEU|nr:GNAT family N-acetyltransferase [Lentzea sp. BCCO 10_0856]MDX8030562.1 GNAT family N-acetyltransferase [Lentzea sp. BCCO 10_0856]